MEQIPILFEKAETIEKSNPTKDDLIKAFSAAVIGLACPFLFLIDDVRKIFE